MTHKDFKYDRRSILLAGGALASGLITGRSSLAQASDRPTLDPDKLEPYVDPLPIPPIARPSGLRKAGTDSSQQVPYFRVAVREFSSSLHRDLRPTKQWGYNGISPGPTFEVTSQKGMFVEWANELPLKHFLPVDFTLHGSERTKPEVRIASHLHGGRVRPEFDGYPEDWHAPGASAIHYYPNGQDAAHLWYHDHAMGINRLNIYAGMFGHYFVRDPTEDALNLPRGEFEVPLVVFDRFLDQQCQLYYPVSGDPKSPWVPEVFGNLILVNGKLLPYLQVAPRPYRFRVLNASNGRHYYFSFLNGEEFHQIGSDQGLLEAPVPMRTLPLAPGERADLIVDFSRFSGRQIILKNDAIPVMQFRVAPGPAVGSAALPAQLRPVLRIAEAEAAQTRVLTLGEMEDMASNPTMMLLNGMHWDMPVTEKPVLNSTEIWNLVNLTDDTHPIHLHLVRFQILDRRPFDRFAFQQTKELRYFGAAQPSQPNERGWKDTVRAHSKMVTRIIVPFRGYAGRYVWHCHILEHEDNEMMRPFEIVPG